MNKTGYKRNDVKRTSESFFYHFYKTLFNTGLRTYYREITVQGADNIPTDGPIMTVSNHPTGLMDVFLASFNIKRQIKFTAAGGLFKDKLQAAFLSSAGAIPLYRRKDTPNEMDKNVSSFEACFQELEAGGAIGFYPEGTSHPEPWLNPIKTGAARVALEVEDRNDFQLKLKIIPIGINSIRPGVFRGFVFVNLGKLISLEGYRDLYRKDPVATVEQLTAEIQQQMENCTFHVKDESVLNLVEDLKTIGFDDINLSTHNPKGKASKFYFLTKVLENKINQGDDDVKKHLVNLAEKANVLKTEMQKFGITDHPFKGIKTIFNFILLFIISLLGLPFIIPATIVNFLPFILAKNLGRKLAGKDISLIPAARLMMGTVIFLIFYLLLFIIIGIMSSFILSLIICLFLLMGGYLIFWYWEVVKAFRLNLRKIYFWFTGRKEIQRLINQRDEFIHELNALV